MALDFSNSKGSNMANKVMKKAASTDMDNKKRDIDVDQIDLNPDNESVFGYDDIDFLANTIEENGFNGVIEVYALDNGRYEISSGHRRYLAAKKLGMKSVPCLVSENVDDSTKAKRLIMSNIHHRKMSPYQWAKALDYFDTHVLSNSGKWHQYEGGRRAELARQFGMASSVVQRYLVLLKLIPEFQEWTKNQNFPYGNLASIAPMDPDLQKEIYDELIKKAPEGNLGALSATIIKQTAETVIQRREYLKQKEEQQKELSEDRNQSDESTSIEEEMYSSTLASTPDQDTEEDDSAFIDRMNDRLLAEDSGNENPEPVSFNPALAVPPTQDHQDRAEEPEDKEINDNSKECLYYVRRLGSLKVSKETFKDESEKQEMVNILEKLLEMLK